MDLWLLLAMTVWLCICECSGLQTDLCMLFVGKNIELRSMRHIMTICETMITYCIVCFYCSVKSDSWQPMDCSPPSSSVHGISQARMLKWVVISFSRGSSQPRIDPRVKPRSPALQADSLPFEPLGKPMIT